MVTWSPTLYPVAGVTLAGPLDHSFSQLTWSSFVPYWGARDSRFFTFLTITSLLVVLYRGALGF